MIAYPLLKREGLRRYAGAADRGKPQLRQYKTRRGILTIDERYTTDGFYPVNFEREERCELETRAMERMGTSMERMGSRYLSNAIRTHNRIEVKNLTDGPYENVHILLCGRAASDAVNTLQNR